MIHVSNLALCQTIYDQCVAFWHTGLVLYTLQQHSYIIHKIQARLLCQIHKQMEVC